ncbi:TrkA family potassium uptake protein [Schnuerera sp. xch1]|uniref:potassium channel family protein n=1 Tax=Schnuerera sp. xch1 TaxID=2874283 RepID=UPI001CC13595|nr:TrkA family potassium uptake protein [Schnuerera sp. xch1]MBZ2175451.1 TrkA family potassium uptake protein [Schnuerera sp. xch1]
MKQFAVIGCGRFGSSIAKTLYSLGHDVLAVDLDMEVIEDIANSVTHAVQADVTDDDALKALGLDNFDVVIVSIASNLEASIMSTLIAKESGAKKIVAKAQNELHGKLLSKIGADKVVFPERDIGIRVAHNILSSNILDYIELSQEYSIIEISAIKEWEGKTLKQLSLPKKYGINVIAIKQGEDINILPNADDIINKGNIFIVIGNNESLRKLENKTD